MLKNEIISKLYLSSFMSDLLSTITGGHALKEELKQELFLILCEMPDEKIEQAYKNNYLNYLCINIVKKQYHSSSSPFHKKFRKDKFQELYDNYVIDDIDDDIDDELLEKVLWFLDNKVKITDRELFKMYYKMEKYDRWLGELRDENCEKPISSTRKIERKLAIESSVPGKKKITIDHSTIALSIKKTMKRLKKYLKENGYNI